MNVFYEEDGGFKVGSVLADNDASLQVEAPHGKRSKIKSSNVLLRFDTPSAGELMSRAEAEAKNIDVDFLWQCCGVQEFDYASLGQEYFGRAPTPIEAAALLLRLHGAPMYFYKKGKGRYKAAPQDALKAALASVERKRLQEETKARYVAELGKGVLPEAFSPLVGELLYDPDKNSLEYKALEAACLAHKTTAAKLLHRCGAFASAHEYHLNRFLYQYFPRGTAFTPLAPPAVPLDLPLAEVRAFSIDDVTTTEIDDAFSVQTLDSGRVRIGIHIAAPALGVEPGSEVDRMARERLSTVYFPGDKITMLPEAVVEQFTLQAGAACPALSLYLTLSTPDYALLQHETRVERVPIAANLRHDSLEQVFNQASIGTDAGEYPFKRELLTLWRAATALEVRRGKLEPAYQPVDYNFYVEDGRVRIVPRLRGSPIDKVVSELMIAANATWGAVLAEQNLAAIYRTQGGGKVSMSLTARAHEGLGVEQYAWSSSPLRRYVDLVNQRQLLAWAQGRPAPYSREAEEIGAAMRAFEMAYDAYAEFQRAMERYWCLRYLAQEQVEETTATVLREATVRLAGMPLVCRVPSLPNLAPSTEVHVVLGDIDEWELGVACQFKAKAA